MTLHSYSQLSFKKRDLVIDTAQSGSGAAQSCQQRADMQAIQHAQS
ncbi:MAG: hypothetical protein ACI8PT_001656, partial [Gammaproteobacteria bacterium]